MFISEATHHSVRGLVETSFAGERTIKGKSNPQKVYQLEGVRPGITRFEAALSRGLSTFVGREGELGVFERSLDEARSQLAVVDVVGEPGIGKSHLLFLTQEQFKSWLSGDGGAEYLKPAPNDYLQRWPVSKRVNSSKADADDPTLIDRVQSEAA